MPCSIAVRPADKKAWLLALSSLLLLLALARPAAPHEIRPAIADIDVSADRVSIDISFSVEPMLAGLDLSAIFDTNQSALADRHDALRALPPAELEERFRAAWPGLSDGFQLSSGGQNPGLDLIAVTVDPVGNTELPRDSRLRLAAALPPGDAPVVFGWAAEYGALVLRQVSDRPETAYTGYLTGGRLSEPIPRAGGVGQSWLAGFANYIRLGFEHIVPKGLDHILFVLGLYFFSTSLRPLLWQVSAFTLAHTATLALATLGIVTLPAAVVEPLIAASIIYVAVENLLSRRLSGWRTAIVFCFGLLHGLGFASVLGEIGLDPARLISGLLGFNLGVELGQLAILAGAYAAVGFWFGQKTWYRGFIANPASVAIALVGAYWLVERLFG